MNLTRQFQTLICGVLFWMTDEQVTLTAESGLNSFVCGSPETLICTTAPSPALMTWKIDNTQAATCFGKTCTPNSVFNSSYIFTFDVENGTFGLQKKKVTLLDNGTTFICQDGFTSDSVIANVIVKDDFDSFENRATTDNSTKRLEYKVTTGCLHDDIAANVIFKWYYKKVYSTDSRIEYDSSSDEQTGSNDSNCRSDSDCGVDGLTQKSSLLYITKADKGDTCTLEVDIKFGSTKTINVNFNTTFILKETMPNTTGPTNKTTTPPPPHGNNSLSLKTIIVITVVAVIIFAIVCTIICWYLRKQINAEKNKHSPGDTQLTDTSKT